MLFTNVVNDDSGTPPVAVLYQFIAVPVADKSEILAPAQKVCDALPDGLAVLVSDTVTSNLDSDSQLLAICDA